MKKIISIFAIAIFSSLYILSLNSCKKDPRNAPKVEFNSGATLISTDAILPKDTTIVVQVKGTKVEDDMKTLNASVVYDGGTSQSKQDFTSISATGFTQDFTIKIRNQAGSEVWTFAITDKDGNIGTNKLSFTVK